MSRAKVEELKARLASLDAEDEYVNIHDYNGLVKDVLKSTGDRAWAEKICKTVERKIAGRGGVFYEYCLLARGVMDNLKDRDWAAKLLKNADDSVGETIGDDGLDVYDILEAEDSFYAIVAKAILDVLGDEPWAAEIIVYAISECEKEKDVAPGDCAYLLACGSDKFADKVWKQILEEELTDAKCFRLADEIMAIDDRIYNEGKPWHIENILPQCFDRVIYNKSKSWHLKNIKRAKAFMRKGIDIVEENRECDDYFDLDSAESAINLLNDAKLTKLFKEFKEEAYPDQIARTRKLPLRKTPLKH